jgi:hypothetical protein
MSATERVRAEFAQSDSDRLRTLANEIQERLNEIGQLAAAARGAPLPPGTKVKFVPKGNPQGKTLHSADNPYLIEILDMPDGTTCCAVWEDAGGPAKLYCPC